jgi:hypothetical protein
MRGIPERGWLTWQDGSGKADTSIDPPAIFEYANDPKVTAVRFSFFRQISIRRDCRPSKLNNMPTNAGDSNDTR